MGKESTTDALEGKATDTFGGEGGTFYIYTCRLTLKRQPGCDDTRGCFGWRAGAARARLCVRLLVTAARTREIDRMTPAHACIVSPCSGTAYQTVGGSGGNGTGDGEGEEDEDDQREDEEEGY